MATPISGKSLASPVTAKSVANPAPSGSVTVQGKTYDVFDGKVFVDDREIGTLTQSADGKHRFDVNLDGKRLEGTLEQYGLTFEPTGSIQAGGATFEVSRGDVFVNGKDIGTLKPDATGDLRYDVTINGARQTGSLSQVNLHVDDFKPGVTRPNQWVAPGVTPPADVRDLVASLKAEGQQVELLGVSNPRNWGDGHYELVVNGQQNAYQFDAASGSLVQRSGDQAKVLAPRGPDEWAARKVSNDWATTRGWTAYENSAKAVRESPPMPPGALQLRDGQGRGAVFVPDGQGYKRWDRSGGDLYDVGLASQQSPARTGETRIIEPGGDVKGAIENARRGDTIQLRAGAYSINQTIRVPDGVTVNGAGADTVITNTATRDEARGFFPISFLARNETAISNLTIDGNHTSDTGVRIEGNNNKVVGVTVKNTGAHGINLERANNNTIAGCTITGSAYTGIAMWQCDDNTLADNVSSHNGSEGITLDHGSSRNTVSGNTLEGNCARGGVGGIGMDGGRETDPSQPAANNLIERNTIRGTINAFAGITCQNNEGPCTGNIIRDNTIEHAGGPGIWLKYNEYPAKEAQWNGTGNKGPTASNDNVVENNTVRVRDWAAGQNALVVDGGSNEAMREKGRLDAQLALVTRSVRVGDGSANRGNRVQGNHD